MVRRGTLIAWVNCIFFPFLHTNGNGKVWEYLSLTPEWASLIPFGNHKDYLHVTSTSPTRLQFTRYSSLLFLCTGFYVACPLVPYTMIPWVLFFHLSTSMHKVKEVSTGASCKNGKLAVIWFKLFHTKFSWVKSRATGVTIVFLNV